MAHSNTSLFDLIFDVVRQIPQGRVTTYGAIAKCIGAAKSARIVGWAMNQAAVLPEVPAHRVVNRNGLLTGKHHFATPTTMVSLLKAEGITVVDDKIQNFETVFWDPISLIS
jgi:methylated-DNA-protein-cysteine methyltransferase-like protein